MTEAELASLIVGYIREHLLDGQDLPVDPDENIFASGLVDSVGIMRLIAHLEATLRRRIPPKDLVPENFRTIRVMAAYLESGESPASSGD